MRDIQRIERSDEFWDQVKTDYIDNNMRLTQLSLKYQVSPNTLKDKIYLPQNNEKPWRQQKKEIHRRLLDEAICHTQQEYIDIFCDGTEIVKTVFADIKKDLKTDKLRPSEKAALAKQASEILKNIHHVISLASGQATQNIAVSHTVNKELDALKILDDFGVIELDKSEPERLSSEICDNSQGSELETIRLPETDPQ